MIKGMQLQTRHQLSDTLAEADLALQQLVPLAMAGARPWLTVAVVDFYRKQLALTGSLVAHLDRKPLMGEALQVRVLTEMRSHLHHLLQFSFDSELILRGHAHPCPYRHTRKPLAEPFREGTFQIQNVLQNVLLISDALQVRQRCRIHGQVEAETISIDTGCFEHDRLLSGITSAMSLLVKLCKAKVFQASSLPCPLPPSNPPRFNSLDLSVPTCYTVNSGSVY